MVVPESRRGFFGWQLAAGLLLGIVVGYSVWGGRGAENTTPRAGKSASYETVDESSRELAEKDATIERLNERMAEKDAQLHRAQQVSGNDKKAPVRAPAPGKGPRFIYPGTEKRFRAVDWKESATALVALNPILVGVAKTIEAGQRITPETMGDIMKHVAPLITSSLQLSENKPEHTRDASSHPAALVNFIDATLREAGLELDERQAAELDTLGVRYIAEDATRRAAYGVRTPEMRKMLDEADLQDRFYADVRHLLTSAQHDNLFPAATRGYFKADLWSGTHLFDEQVKILTYRTREEVEEERFEFFEERLQLSDAL